MCKSRNKTPQVCDKFSWSTWVYSARRLSRRNAKSRHLSWRYFDWACFRSRMEYHTGLLLIFHSHERQTTDTPRIIVCSYVSVWSVRTVISSHSHRKTDSARHMQTPAELGWSTAARYRRKAWRGVLYNLESLTVPRCYKPKDFGEMKELHHFSDASQIGYGQCSNVRIIDDRNQVHCSLVMAKARVAPVRPVTIPRLELTAAVLSVRIAKYVKLQLNYEEVTEVFWTDSDVVLG